MLTYKNHYNTVKPFKNKSKKKTAKFFNHNNIVNKSYQSYLEYKVYYTLIRCQVNYIPIRL